MRKFLPILFLILLIVPMVAFAQTANPCSISAIPESGNKAQALPRCVNQIYVWALGISALLAMLMLVIGGYYYMTARGNAEQSGKGVEIIWSAIIGMALLFGAYLLLNTINPDLVTFPVDSFNGVNQTAPPSAPRQP